MLRSDDGGKLVLRLAIGILMLLHGIAKLVGGIGFITGLVTSLGLPASFAYLVFVGEVLAPIGLILGVFTRISALLVVINMVVAITLAHVPELFSLSKSGGWALELQGLFLFGSLAIMLLGAGRFSLQRPTSRWN
ncbi:MAG: DoxX family protein [Burkholderiaceae bacterium]|nr:DoxX family protein [Burkholderiaceae bacterium]